VSSIPDTLLTSDELEQLHVAPFVRLRFPTMPSEIMPVVTQVKPEQTRISPNADKYHTLPAQYSFVYSFQNCDCQMIVYVLADATGEILRTLVSK